SNASDAADKLRCAAMADDARYEGDASLQVRVEVDAKAGTITITDNGMRMTRDEIIGHLGTVAKAGTAQFLKSLTGDQKKDSQLIGQFGVGFYSAFIVADRVEVFTRKAGAAAEAGVHWESSGEADYSVETVTRPQRGTSVVLHLKTAEQDFADVYRLRSIVKKYADHIAIPVLMEKQSFGEETETEEGKEKEFEAVNSAKAL